MSERPGIMLYFSEWIPMLKLDDSTLASVLRAAIMYGYAGEVPSFEGINAVMWAMIADKLDRDSAAYEERCRKARWSRYKGIEEQHGRKPLRYDEWITEVDQRQPTSRMADGFDETEPEKEPESEQETKSESESEQETQGDYKGGEPYKPLTEAAFEERRQEMLSKLGVSW